MAGNGNIDFFCLECYTGKSEVNTLQTEVIKLDRENMDLDDLKRAGEIIKSGGLVAFPTETVYGLGGDGLHEESSRKIYEAKGRPSDNPLIVHVADMEHLEKIVKKVPKAAYKLAEAFWPGPMTMILEKNDLVPYGTTGGLDTVAIRMPSDPIALELIRQGGGYIAAPSANTSGRPSPTTAQHVYEDLQGKIPMILDGGAVTIGLESTIVDLTEEIPTILRPGFISLDMVQAVLGEAQIDRGLIANDSNIHPKAPGMKYRHYAPKAKLTIVEGSLKEEVFAIRQLAYEKSRQGVQVGIIGTNETVEFYTHGLVKNIGSRENEKTIARNLYRILREFDEEDVSEIYSESFAIQGIGNAIMNRLEKAAGHCRIPASVLTKEQKYRKIVFVSNTDTCRGPVAAEIFRHQSLDQEYWIESKGMVVLFPEPVNQKAEAILKSNQMTLEGYTSRPFTEKNLNPETLILTMAQAQKEKILSEYPNEYTDNVYTLTEFTGETEEIPDPYGQPLTAYGECYEKITLLIEKLAEILNSFTKGGQ